MTFARGVFIFAFVMLITGAVGARVVLGPLLFGDVGNHSYSIASAAPSPTTAPRHMQPAPRLPRHVAASKPTPIRAPAATATVTVESLVTATPQPTTHAVHAVVPVRPRSALPTATGTSVVKQHYRRVATPTSVVTATTVATPVPTSTPSGIVALDNYWVGSSTTRPGTTIAVGYVIDNQTGKTARIELGASVKASNQTSWATAAISDPGHDVVAIVPPGVSHHVRYFTLSSGLRSGSYDIAWGLRDPTTGDRVALVAARSALQVQGLVPAP